MPIKQRYVIVCAQFYTANNTALDEPAIWAGKI
jgi:hypothetical protein